MAKPLFVSTAVRPAERDVVYESDNLTVSKINATSKDNKSQLEKFSGGEIKTDEVLQETKEAVVANSTAQHTSAVGTDEATSVLNVENEEQATELAKLQEELQLGMAARDACPDGLSCPWFDFSGLQKSIDLSAYGDKLGGLLDSILLMGNAGLFGNIVRCASYIAAVGLKGLNETADLVSGLGNTDMLAHLGEAIKGKFGDDASADTKLVDLRDKIMVTSGNGGNINPFKLKDALTSLSFSGESLIHPFDEDDPIVTEQKSDVVSSEDIAKLISFTDRQVTPATVDPSNKSSVIVQEQTINNIIIITGTSDEAAPSIGMTSGVANNINNGGVPSMILTPDEYAIYSNMAAEDAASPHQAINNIRMGNVDDVKENNTQSELAITQLNAGVSDVDFANVCIGGRQTVQATGLSEEEISDDIYVDYEHKYDVLNAQYA